MASIKKEYDASGNVVYKVQVSGGRGRRVKRSWRPEPGWSARTIERELHKFAASLENELSGGTLLTRKEDLEQQRQAALEAAKIKTLRQYVDGVFMPKKSIRLAENSRSSYKQFLDKHILPVLGDFPMQDISSAMLDKLILDFQHTGYAHSSAVKLYNILRGVFKAARSDHSIAQNPMFDVERPKPRKDEPIQDESDKYYTVQQLRYILECLQGEPLKWQVYVRFVADTGVRRGEAVGIHWEDIDWKESSVTIRRNIQYTKDAGVYVTIPKNKKVRRVDIGPDTLKLLRQLRTEQASRAISKYVFTREGSPEVMFPQSPTRYFAKFGKKYGIENFHPHGLRHSSASIAIGNGASVVDVSRRLGHSDPSVTLRMYSHTDEGGIRRAGQTVRDALEAKEKEDQAETKSV